MTADFYSFFNNFTILYGYYCFHCGNAEIGSTGYCKTCGTQVSIFAKSCSRIFYTGVKVNENGRAIKCPRCGNEAFSPKEKYCNICGASLFNVCEGVPIVDSYGNIFVSTHHINDGNARYCSKCGSRTAFYKQGFLKKWTAANNVEYQHDAVAETRPDLYEMKDGS
ncbi:zinc ribbon domain-containing protein [Sporotomaculum syntrophicum]|nr:zinc ribbon domain-containing protein [Sporotomaculum syntrophicum]